jgi:hypothetical protein
MVDGVPGRLRGVEADFTEAQARADQKQTTVGDWCSTCRRESDRRATISAIPRRIHHARTSLRPSVHWIVLPCQPSTGSMHASAVEDSG